MPPLAVGESISWLSLRLIQELKRKEWRFFWSPSGGSRPGSYLPLPDGKACRSGYFKKEY